MTREVQMKRTRRQFGTQVRALRRLKGMGLRELARIARISPTFLSKVEAGNGPPPTEARVRELARVLGVDEDELVVLSGRVPSELTRIIARHPREYVDLVRATQGLSIERLRHVHSYVRWISKASQANLRTADVGILGDPQSKPDRAS